MASEKRLPDGSKSRLRKIFETRNVQAGMLLVVAMFVVLLFLPSITPSSVLYLWFVPLIELILGCLLVIIIILSHFDKEVQRVRDEAGIEPTGILLPRRKTEGWFFSVDNVYRGKSLGYSALKAYIVLLAKDGFWSFKVTDVAAELKLGDKQKNDGLRALLSTACDDGLITASPDKATYTIVATKDGDINIKKTVKKRLPLEPPSPRPSHPSRPSRPPIRRRKKR